MEFPGKDQLSAGIEQRHGDGMPGGGVEERQVTEHHVVLGEGVGILLAHGVEHDSPCREHGPLGKPCGAAGMHELDNILRVNGH